MTPRALTWTVAAACSFLGVAIFVATLGVAKQEAIERPTVIATSLPRPPFSLDDRMRGEPGRIGQHEVAEISREELEFIHGLTRRAATVFEVPEWLLAHEVGRAMQTHRDGSGHRLEPLGADVIRDLNVPRDAETRDSAGKLIAFLGHDPRPFDSYLSRRTELGVAARAAHLRSRHAVFVHHLESQGIAASEETLWFLAMLVTKRGDREVTGAMEEGLDLGPRRLGRALADLDPTVRLFTDDAFVFRAFLRVWAERDARARTDAFIEDVAKLAKVFRTPEKTSDAPGVRARG